MGFEPSTIKLSIFIAYGCKIVNVQQWRWVNKLWASEVASDPSLLSSAIAHNVSTRSIEASSILSSTSYSPWRRCIYVNVMVTFLSWTVIDSEALLGYPLRIWALRLPLSVVLSLSKWSKVCLHAWQTQEWASCTRLLPIGGPTSIRLRCLENHTSSADETCCVLGWCIHTLHNPCCSVSHS